MVWIGIENSHIQTIEKCKSICNFSYKCVIQAAAHHRHRNLQAALMKQKWEENLWTFSKWTIFVSPFSVFHVSQRILAIHTRKWIQYETFTYEFGEAEGVFPSIQNSRLFSCSVLCLYLLVPFKHSFSRSSSSRYCPWTLDLCMEAYASPFWFTTIEYNSHILRFRYIIRLSSKDNTQKLVRILYQPIRLHFGKIFELFAQRHLLSIRLHLELRIKIGIGKQKSQSNICAFQHLYFVIGISRMLEFVLWNQHLIRHTTLKYLFMDEITFDATVCRVQFMESDNI